MKAVGIKHLQEQVSQLSSENQRLKDKIEMESKHLDISRAHVQNLRGSSSKFESEKDAALHQNQLSGEISKGKNEIRKLNDLISQIERIKVLIIELENIKATLEEEHLDLVNEKYIYAEKVRELENSLSSLPKEFRNRQVREELEAAHQKSFSHMIAKVGSILELAMGTKSRLNQEKLQFDAFLEFARRGLEELELKERSTRKEKLKLWESHDRDFENRFSTDHGMEVKRQEPSSDSFPQMTLRDYLYGRKDKRGRKRGCFCWCGRPRTNEN